LRLASLCLRFARCSSPLRMAARLRCVLLLPLTCALALSLGSAQACEKHLRGHSSGSDTAAQTSQN